MVVFAELTAPATDFPLGRLLDTVPGGRARLDRVVPVGSQGVPYLWIEDVPLEDVETELSTDEEVASYQVVDAMGERVLVGVEWVDRCKGFVDAVRSSEGALLEGVGRRGQWRFEVRFPDHATLSTFFDTCRDRGLDLALSKVLNPGLAEDSGTGSLTDPQREALFTALEAGYFEVPRRASLKDLSELLGVSDSAVSQRLRRGTAAFLRGNVATGDGGTDHS